MRKAIIIFIFIFTALFVKGQDTTRSAQPSVSGGLSLQQAIDYAYQHQGNMMNAQIDAELSDQKVKEVRGIGLPQISGSIDAKYYPEVPTTTFPDFNTGQQTAIKFGTPWNSTVGVSASQLLFNPTFFVGLNASKSYRELSEKNIIRSKIETNVAVSKAYYNVLVSNERLQFLDANMTRLKKLRDDTEAMFKNGFVEKIDLDRVTLAYNNLIVEKGNADRFALLSEYLLKFQMGMRMNDTLSLTDSLSYSEIKDETVSTGIPDITSRIEYSILNSQKHLQELDLRRYKVAYYPTLAAYGTVGTNAFRDKFDLYYSDRKWYPMAFVGATLSMNLFDGTQREHRISQAKLNLKRTENDITKAQDALTLEAINARTSFQNSLESYRSQKENLDLANEVIRVSKIKYDQGVGSNLEVVQAETALREALTNYYNALYNVLVTKIDLNKSLGKIQ